MPPPSNPSDPSDPSNLSTPLSPPSPPTSSPTLSSITHSLLQTAFSLKRDFRFLKLTVRESSHSPLEIALHESETHKLLRTSLLRLNWATRNFIRDANVLLDEEVNRSFDAYLRHSNSFRDSKEGLDDDDGGDEHLLDGMMTIEEKETRKELRRLLGVVQELRGVWWRRAGRYLLGGGGKELKDSREGREGEVGREVEDLVVRELDRDRGRDGKGDEGEGEKEMGDEEIKVGLERLAERLGMGKREEARVHRL